MKFRQTPGTKKRNLFLNMNNNIIFIELLNQADLLPVEKINKIKALIEIFQEIDQKVLTFKKYTGFQCLSGCSACCQNTFVTASPLEMFPLALYLYQQETLEQWIDRGVAAQHHEQSSCIFYSKPTLPEKEGCSIYPFRPLVCRLFGFTARENKNQKYELMICHKIKKKYAKAYHKALVINNPKNRRAPVSSNYVMKTYGISPQLAGNTIDINLAFLKAAETIGYDRSLFNLNKKGAATIY